MKLGYILILAALLSGCTQSRSADERETYLLHEGLHRVARLSLKILRAIPADEPDVKALRAEARAHLTVYSKEVSDLSGKYDWPLLNDPLVEEIRQYLNEAEPPNNSRH